MTIRSTLVLLSIVIFQLTHADDQARVLIGNPVDVQLRGDKPKTLASSMVLRRKLAWQVVAQIFSRQAIREKALSIPSEESYVPTWLTWLEGRETFSTFFDAYVGLSGAARNSDTYQIPRGTFEQNSQALVERAMRDSNWSDSSYNQRIAKIDDQRKIWGSRGPQRVLLSPSAASHISFSYRTIADCFKKDLDFQFEEGGHSTKDRSLCFLGEMPGSAVAVKAVWRSIDHDGIPVYDTSAQGLSQLSAKEFHWAPTHTIDHIDPTNIFEMELENGARYQLVGLHIISKVLKDWFWITIWWSPESNSDFGEDRPDSVAADFPQLKNYKMCAVTHYDELDSSVDSLKSWPKLSAAIDETRKFNGTSTWCSNPYIEEGVGNARTNCIGCHQHAGSKVLPEDILKHGGPFTLNGLQKVRKNFPSDYLWSLEKGPEPAPPEMVKLMDYFKTIDGVRTLFRELVPFSFPFTPP